MKVIETLTMPVDGVVVGKMPMHPAGKFTRILNNLIPGQRFDRPAEGFDYRIHRGLHAESGNGVSDVLGNIRTDRSKDFAIDDPVTVFCEERVLFGSIPLTRIIKGIELKSPQSS